ncbi:hypothetical protein D5S17_24445 [Pseudonocardiaceae bacterium YIM PH 21723]|nr:hypothetical protein D5S17_24445 [Pseudonocardiaceae bacterium YIM PH 21723]
MKRALLGLAVLIAGGIAAPMAQAEAPKAPATCDPGNMCLFPDFNQQGEPYKVGLDHCTNAPWPGGALSAWNRSSKTMKIYTGTDTGCTPDGFYSYPGSKHNVGELVFASVGPA